VNIPIIVPDAFCDLSMPAATPSKIGASQRQGGRETSGNSDFWHWRERAEKARVNADKMKDDRLKHRMLGLADTYERLAKQIEQHTWRRQAGAALDFKVAICSEPVADSPGASFQIARNLPLAAPDSAAGLSGPRKDDKGTDPGHRHQRGHNRRFR
jgi:hypothetical protein